MFGRLTRLLDNFSKLSTEKIFLSIISDSGIQEYIISLNLADQIFIDGVDSNGGQLGTYADSTLDSKGGRTYGTKRAIIDDNGFVRSEVVSKTISEGDSYILLEDSKLYDSYTVIVDGGGFSLSADTMKIEGSGKNKGKSVDINLKYGGIVGLNEKSKTELAEAIIPIVIRKIRNSLIGEVPSDLF